MYVLYAFGMSVVGWMGWEKHRTNHTSASVPLRMDPASSVAAALAVFIPMVGMLFTQACTLFIAGAGYHLMCANQAGWVAWGVAWLVNGHAGYSWTCGACAIGGSLLCAYWKNGVADPWFIFYAIFCPWANLRCALIGVVFGILWYLAMVDINKRMTESTWWEKVAGTRRHLVDGT